jgi:uncharacterized protein YjbI with pentapeptide repeats
MNIVKSLHSSLLHRHFSFQEKHYFTASVLWGFNLQTGEPVLEQDLWLAIGDMIGKSELFDAGMPKANAELLVQGSCYAPDGEAVNASRVSVSLGSIKKEFMVFGDRQWIKGLGVGWGVSDPVKFTEMPISYSNAFGGQNYAANPVGKGIDEVDISGEQLVSLPNLEYSNDLIGSPGDKPRPASLNRIDMMCEQRMSKAGTYDQRYIETRMPGFPDDFNYDYFNDAAKDQQIEGFFKGDEHYEIRNMHSQHALIKGQIPSVYGRAFVNHQVNDEIVFKEIPTQLDTLWLFPGSELGVMIHRGTLEINEDDAADIKQILVANENTSDTPRSAEHYKNELALRTNLAEAYKYAFYTVPLIPEGMTCGFKVMEDKSDFPYEQLASSNLKNHSDLKQQEAEVSTQQQFDKMKEQYSEDSPERQKIDDMIKQLEAAKVNPPELGTEEKAIKAITEKIVPMMKDDPTKPDMTRLNLKAIDELKDYMDGLKSKKDAEIKKTLLEQIEEIKKFDVEGETSPQVKQLENLLVTMTLPPILPRIDVEGILKHLKDQNDEIEKQLLVMQSMGLPEEQLSKTKQALNTAEIEKRGREDLDKANDSYRLGAHGIEQARSPHEGQEEDIRVALLSAFKSGRKTARGDYAFVDLSDQDLTGIDLSGSYLEYANLTNTNLSNANLSKAILSHAILNNTNLSNTNLTDANLGSIHFEGTVISDSDLTGATLSKSTIANTRFERCKMAEKMDMFLETKFDNARFIECDLRKNVFIDAEIDKCSFTGSDLTESNFVNPKMAAVNFSNAILTSVNFVNAQGSGAKFENASMKNARFLSESCLSNTNFQHANLSEANLMGCNLQNAKFSGATLFKTEFGGADLTKADLGKTNAVQAQFAKANLTDAHLERINMLEGSFYKAILSGAHFYQANLYNVNFMGCTVGETDFTGADLEQTIFKDWRP